MELAYYTVSRSPLLPEHHLEPRSYPQHCCESDERISSDWEWHDTSCRRFQMTLVAWLSFDSTPEAQPTHPSALPGAARSPTGVPCRPIGQHCKVSQESLATARKERTVRLLHLRRGIKSDCNRSFVMRRAVSHASLSSFSVALLNWSSQGSTVLWFFIKNIWVACVPSSAKKIRLIHMVAFERRQISRDFWKDCYLASGCTAMTGLVQHRMSRGTANSARCSTI